MKSMNLLFGIVLSLGLSLAALGCAVEPAGDPVGVVTLGEAAAVRFEVAFRGPPTEGENEIVLVPTRVADGARIPMAELSVLPPEMPAMGHISTVRPEVHEEEPGRYAVGDIVVTMPGTWRMRVQLDAPGASDTATIELEVR